MDKNHALALDYLNIVTLMGIYGVFTIYNCEIESQRSPVLSYCDMKKSNWIYPVTSIKSHKNMNLKKNTRVYIIYTSSE